MNEVFHEGEYRLQELMGVRQSSDALASMVKDTIPQIAKDFLINLKFCVITLSKQEDDLTSAVIYDMDSFISIIGDKAIDISLRNSSFIDTDYFKENEFSIGFLGLDFEKAMRIRINGLAKINNNTLRIFVNEVYSNCPKYIIRRIYKSNLKEKLIQNVQNYPKLTTEIMDMISQVDTFFLSSLHKDKGADISHRGGNKGFLKVISSNEIQFDDKPGNNLYNTLGNIYTNSIVNILLIDFENNNTYLILARASFTKIYEDEKYILRITLSCSNIIKNTNSFLMDYSSKLN
jgi:predicted pyridoxine 5'-phosphate oxidase superfamily flavin-nucleotide-binding protein